MTRPRPTQGLLIEKVKGFTGYAYSSARVGYPEPLPGVVLPLVERGAPRATNCCCFVEAVVVRAFADVDGETDWGKQRHDLAMCIGDRFGPVTALVDAGMADPVPERRGRGAWPDTWIEPGWLVVQGWRSPSSGHTMLVRVLGSPLCTIIEANMGWGLRGAGVRGAGRLEDIDGEPHEQLPTWSLGRLAFVYRELKAARLRLAEPEPLRIQS